jgi:acetyl esterase/lipase
VRKARWAGIPVRFEIWQGMFHCWQVFANQVPEGKEAIDHIGIFIQAAGASLFGFIIYCFLPLSPLIIKGD